MSYQYSVGKPLFFYHLFIASHRCFIELSRALSSYFVIIWCQESIIVSIMVPFISCLIQTRIFKLCHHVFDEIEIKTVSWPWQQFNVLCKKLFWYFCCVARSSILMKINESLLGKRSLVDGRSFGSGIVSMYFIAFSIPSITWRRLAPSAIMHDQINHNSKWVFHSCLNAVRM